jgi:hypothetical protein
MIFDIVKSFFIENRIKKSLNKTVEVDQTKIVTMGLLIDISDKNLVEQIKNELNLLAIDLTKTKTLAFMQTLKKDESFNFDVVSMRDYSLMGDLKNEKALQFINYPFDLLINYFEDHQQALNELAIKSKAKFKVGFKNQYNNYNNLYIETRFEQVDLFVSETFKYLKILNKI